jgi:hypothetical protein
MMLSGLCPRNQEKLKSSLGDTDEDEELEEQQEGERGATHKPKRSKFL